MAYVSFAGVAVVITLSACSVGSAVRADAAAIDAAAVSDDAGVAADYGPDFVSLDPCIAPSDYMLAAGVTGVTAGLGRPESVGMGIDYRPRCLSVAEGTEVTIEASDLHPLLARSEGTTPSPIPVGPSTSNQTVRFWTPGFYAFECMHHGPVGMRGVIWVQ